MRLGTNMLKCVLQYNYDVFKLLRIYIIQFIKYLFKFYENVIIYLFTIVGTKGGPDPEFTHLKWHYHRQYKSYNRFVLYTYIISF